MTHFFVSYEVLLNNSPIESNQITIDISPDGDYNSIDEFTAQIKESVIEKHKTTDARRERDVIGIRVNVMTKVDEE